MGGSRLEIAGRTIARSEEGALDAEYALFDPGDIDLVAAELGNVREIGYRTKAAIARRRMKHLGVTEALVREAGEAMRAVAEAYARGAAARRVAPQLGATELFEGGTYDGASYVGAWLDTAGLAQDLEEDLDVPHAAAALQALHLTALLYDAPDDAALVLDTAELTLGGRPGHRTHRRPDLDGAPKIPAALAALAARHPAATRARESGPARAELLTVVRERQAWCTEGDAGARLGRLEGLLWAREPPTRGPLADPEMWALERQMSDGDASSALAALDALERARGRTPTTTYLRARASLMLGREEPAIVAARVSALALSMSSFAELELLAAQAWLAAGDARRATPYARDLAENAAADPELRALAEQVLREIDAKRARADAPPAPIAVPHAANELDLDAPEPEPPKAPPPALEMPDLPQGDAIAPTPIVHVEEEPPPDTAIEPAPIVELTTEPHPASAPPPHPTTKQRVTTPLPPGAPALRDGFPASLDPAQRSSAPYSEVSGERRSDRPARRASEAPPRRASSRPPIPEAAPTPVRAPSEPPPSREARAKRRAPPGLVESFDSGWSDTRAEPTSLPPALTPSARGASPSAYTGGAALPAFRHDDGARVELPGAVVSARVDPTHSEAAEHLSMPRGAPEPPARGELPRSPAEARALFTHLSRELGRDYRVRRGVELRTDAHALEAMQAQLFDAYHARGVQTEDDWLDVRAHGAFVSEILARTLGAEWIDVAPSELGYWAMGLPHGARIWPFARVLRYIANGPKERDLVSYYLELKSLALGR